MSSQVFGEVIVMVKSSVPLDEHFGNETPVMSERVFQESLLKVHERAEWFSPQVAFEPS